MPAKFLFTRKINKVFAIFFSQLSQPIIYSLCSSLQNAFTSLDTQGISAYTCAKFTRNAKPMTQTSKQMWVLPESRRWWDGGRKHLAEWTAEGGLNRISSVSTDGLFPRYHGKMCDRTSASGRVIVNLGGTAEVSDFCPKGTCQTWVLEGERSFYFPPDHGKERSNHHGKRKDPL